MISNQIDMFLQINKTPDIFSFILWETLKSYPRGQIISYVNFDKKQKRDKLIDLLKHISQLNSIYADSPSSDVYKERLSLQSEVNTLTADHAVDQLLKSRSNYYVQGDKAGRLLAHQVQQAASSHLILQIWTSLDITIDPKRINDRFKGYYTKLYTSNSAPTTQEFD